MPLALPPGSALRPSSPPGLNLVLVSLPEPRLYEAAKQLATQHGVQVRTVATDLCRAGPDLWAQIGAALKGIQASWHHACMRGAAHCAPVPANPGHGSQPSLP